MTPTWPHMSKQRDKLQNVCTACKGEMMGPKLGLKVQPIKRTPGSTRVDAARGPWGMSGTVLNILSRLHGFICSPETMHHTNRLHAGNGVRYGQHVYAGGCAVVLVVLGRWAPDSQMVVSICRNRENLNPISPVYNRREVSIAKCRRFGHGQL